MAFTEKTKIVETSSGQLVKHWDSCLVEDSNNPSACTCKIRAEKEYWRMDQISNCAYEATGLLAPKQLMFGIKTGGTDFWTGKTNMVYCCSKWCADMYRKELL